MIDGGDTLRRLVLNAVGYSGLAPLARPLVGGIGAILMLHRVTANLERPDGANRHLNIAPAFLDALITDMKAGGTEFVTMDEALERVKRGGKGGQFATLTADDGYRDNLTEALPVLERHGVPITIYIAPALIDGTVDLWWEVIDDIVNARDMLFLNTAEGRVTIDCSSPAKRAEANARLQEYLTIDVREEDQRTALHELARSCGVDPTGPGRKTLMGWEEVRAAAAHPLVTIGAHTVHHYSLKRLNEETARREIIDAGRILESELGEKPRHMAYPYGYPSAVGEREVALAKAAGYASAVTTRHGVLRADHAGHLHALPRISINGRYQRVSYIRTMLSGITTPLANAGKMLVTV
ncbi:polysaccharide deacetylase family protein [Mesorhizobium sp. DCY119]|uniref:polysaccharide deacetylase family protein n=1 Tax=Mesorhizobium sp. DCY119 TaxID=2108445 RepID=UPI000E6BD9A9|nr:polysaccharide deacetylase family protein [Mesorhizobium sp. DCY119]RJG45456.1 polysaccharide deacetylase [Mesorhizobium sp. DCY119]